LAILWLVLSILRGRMGGCRLCLPEGGRREIPMVVPGAVLGARMVSVEVMVVGMVVALEVHEVVVVMEAVAALWALLRHLETGGVVRDLMHTAEEAAAAAAAVVSGVEETATSGLDLSLCQLEEGLTSKKAIAWISC
jgi:hypothetical protein